MIVALTFNKWTQLDNLFTILDVSKSWAVDPIPHVYGLS